MGDLLSHLFHLSLLRALSAFKIKNVNAYPNGVTLAGSCFSICNQVKMGFHWTRVVLYMTRVVIRGAEEDAVCRWKQR